MSKTAYVKANAPFEHEGAGFSAGVHNLPIETAKAVVAAGHAENFTKPKARAADNAGDKAGNKKDAE